MRRSAEQRRAAVAAVQAKMPKQVKRKRRVVTEDGMDAGMEEYIDFIYPDEGAPAPNLKLLEVRYLCGDRAVPVMHLDAALLAHCDAVKHICATLVMLLM